MTKIELQSQIQRKVQELPADVLQELYEYMESILEKRKQQAAVKKAGCKSGGMTLPISLTIT